MQHQSSPATEQSVDENSESEHADDERGGKKATERTVKRLRRAHEGPTTNQKNNDTAGASRPSAAPSATYDDMNDLVTTTARPGAASNVSTRAASVATVPDDKDDSAIGLGPLRPGPSQGFQARPGPSITTRDRNWNGKRERDERKV
ncbi:hypothetical protein PAXINDRAFT_19523 [Paxillus involutus ATCC 200175]|uniref:Uncharacterized protein n=1 Tax=Paxillus involutus ATCC 200175 TaxID=664439 RepID=A0A0C9SN44_PAXIN|nr:hypothetical protein PAXINDRAFT_19523 [Paxillus involutus ATCC 200175]